MWPDTTEFSAQQPAAWLADTAPTNKRNSARTRCRPVEVRSVRWRQLSDGTGARRRLNLAVAGIDHLDPTHAGRLLHLRGGHSRFGDARPRPQPRGWAAAAAARPLLRPPAEGGVVRHTQAEAEQADDGADQAFGLPERQAEHGAQSQGGQDRQG